MDRESDEVRARIERDMRKMSRHEVGDQPRDGRPPAWAHRLVSGPFAGRTVSVEFDLQPATIAALLEQQPAPEGWRVQKHGPVTLLLHDDELVATFVGNAGIHAPLVRNLLEANDRPDPDPEDGEVAEVIGWNLPDVEVSWPEGGLLVRTLGEGLGWQGYRQWPLLAAEDPAALRAHAAVLLGLAQAVEDGPPAKPTGGYAVHDDEQPATWGEREDADAAAFAADLSLRARGALGLPSVQVKRVSPMNVEVLVDGELHSRPLVLPGTEPDLFRRSAAVQLALADWAAAHPETDDERAARVQELVAFAGEAGKVMDWDDAERLYDAGGRIEDDTLVVRPAARGMAAGPAPR